MVHLHCSGLWTLALLPDTFRLGSHTDGHGCTGTSAPTPPVQTQIERYRRSYVAKERSRTSCWPGVCDAISVTLPVASDQMNPLLSHAGSILYQENLCRHLMRVFLCKFVRSRGGVTVWQDAGVNCLRVSAAGPGPAGQGWAAHRKWPRHSGPVQEDLTLELPAWLRSYCWRNCDSQLQLFPTELQCMANAMFCLWRM